MKVANASPASAAFGVRLGFTLQLIEGTQRSFNLAPSVTSLVTHAVTKLREAIRGPPVLDQDLRIHPVRKPLHAQALVPELPVEALVRSVLPGSTRIYVRCIELCCRQPAQNRSRDKLRAVVRSKVLRCAVNADQLRQRLDDSTRPNAAGRIDRQTLAAKLVHDRQALELLTVRARIEHKIVCPDFAHADRRQWRGRDVATRRRGRLRGTCRPARRHRRCVRSALITCPRRPRNTWIRR